MLLVAAAVGGIVVVFCGYVGYRLVSTVQYSTVQYSTVQYRLVRTHRIVATLFCLMITSCVLRSADTSSKYRIPRIILEWTKKSNVATVTKNPTFLHEFP